MSEEWKPIEGFPLYEVSSLGRVRNADGRILTQRLNRYLRVRLCAGGKRHHKSVHRLVAKAFVPGEAPGLVVCHNDSDRLNNRATNLRWDTISENLIDESKRGNHPKQKLDERQVKEIRRRYGSGRCSYRSLSDEFGVTHQAIRDIVIGKNYGWVAA